jgi:hypothetical protein
VLSSSTTASSKTEEIPYSVSERFNRSLVVIDIPGVFDTIKTTEETFAEIGKFSRIIKYDSPGLHALLLVLKIGRFTEEEKRGVVLLLNYFGDQVKRCLIVVFTGKSRLDNENISIKEYIKTMEDSPLIKKPMHNING